MQITHVTLKLTLLTVNKAAFAWAVSEVQAGKDVLF